MAKTPLPNKLHLLHGNPGNHKLKKEGSPLLAQAPTMPVFVKRDIYARREWCRLMPQLEKLGLMTEIYRASFAAYCVSYAHFETVSREMNNVKPDDPRYFDFVRCARQASVTVSKFLNDFGMNPVSRNKVSVASKQGELDEFEQWEKDTK
jgi:P27 family predicted phage terminase small subunit